MIEIEEHYSVEAKLRELRERREREEYYTNLIALVGILLILGSIVMLGHLAWGW